MTAIPVRTRSIRISDDVWKALKADSRIANQILRSVLLPEVRVEHVGNTLRYIGGEPAIDPQIAYSGDGPMPFPDEPIRELKLEPLED